MSDTGRGVPHNLEAERSVLGGLFIKPSAHGEVVALLKTDDFFLPAHREVWDSIQAVVMRGQPLDVIGVGDDLRVRGMLGKLDGGEVYLLTLSNSVPTAENIGHYARLVKEKSVLRRVIAAAAEIQSRARGDFGDFGEFIDECRSGIEAAAQRVGGGAQRIGDLLEDVFSGIEHRQVDADSYRITTGLRDLDEKLGGGYHGGHLGVIAQRPGFFKTAFAVNGAVREAIDGVPVLVFSMEMTQEEMTERALAFATKVPGDNIRRGKVDVEKEWPLLEKRGREVLGGIPLYFHDNSELSFEGVCGEMLRWAIQVDRDALHPDRKKRKRKVVWIDGMSKLRPQKPRRQRSDDVAHMAGALKNLAKRLMCPINLIVHLNREVEKGGKGGRSRRPRMSDLKESGALEQEADVILFPYRSGPRVSGPSEVTIIVEKQRGGEPGDVAVSLDPRYLAFHNASEDDERHDDPFLPGLGG